LRVYNASSISKHKKYSALQAFSDRGKLGVQKLDLKAVLGVKQQPSADFLCRGSQYVHDLLKHVNVLTPVYWDALIRTDPDADNFVDIIPPVATKGLSCLHKSGYSH
jgi:hypothetical protein